MNRRPPARAGSALALLAAASVLLPRAAHAQQATVRGTLHNLSVSGPGNVKSRTEKEICKFCHIPHNAIVPDPLWGHALSSVSQYAVPNVKLVKGGTAPAPQPDGSSRLCLSCHDGTVALGDLGPRRRALQVEGEQRLAAGRRGFLGTDLSGGHPISFVVADPTSSVADEETDIGVKPLERIRADKAVRLDEQGKMQCTTCHEPHADRFFQEGTVPHFWVRPTVTEVCLACHEPR